MGNFNLDDIINQSLKKPEIKTPEAPAGDVGMDIVLTNQPKKAGAMDIKTFYDRNMKLVFLVDRSGSMMDGAKREVLSAADIDWGWEGSGNIPKRIEAYTSEYYSDEVRAVATKLMEQIRNGDMPVDQIKQAIFEAKAWDALGYCAKPAEPIRSKMDIVKSSMNKIVQKRLDKYPDADIAVISFDTQVEVHPCSGKAEILSSIESLYPRGGTAIYSAMDAALRYIARDPSIAANHIVLISDGEDNSALELGRMVEALKAASIVLDYIYIKVGGAYQNGYSQVATVLSQVCKELGGEYKEVTSEKDFETVFLQAAERLCLPPGN